MLPGVQTGNRSRECMFPWTIPDQTVVEAEEGMRNAAHANQRRSQAKHADERPIAYRAWCVEHAEELGSD